MKKNKLKEVLNNGAKHQVIPGIWCANIEDAKKMRDGI